MTTWAIGDLQGCWTTFDALLREIAFDPDVDRLWLVGDLVNRGWGSLEVLRWCVAHDASITAVLGNHDLHLLGFAAGLRSGRSKETLQSILDAEDCEPLLAWLRARPLLHRTSTHVLVHAGLPPWWSLDEAELHARRLEAALRGEPASLLQPLPGQDPVAWEPGAPEADRVALAGLITMRCLDRDRALVRSFNGPPEDRAPDSEPWFASWSGPETVVFGHWAALGYRRGDTWLALDSGCVWGGPLTAVDLASGRAVQVPNQEPIRG